MVKDLRVDKNCGIKSQLKTKLNDVASGDTVDFIGINVGWFNKLQFSLGESTDVEIHKADYQAVTSVTAKTSIEVEVGKSKDLGAKVLPDNATDKELIYDVANPEYAEVFEGRVRGLVAGQTTITVKAHDDESKTFVVNVNVIPTVGELVNAKYSFTCDHGTKAIDDTTKLLNAFTKESGGVAPSSVSNNTNVYFGANGGNSNSGTDYKIGNVLKIGTSSAAGNLTINFADNVKISKVVVNMAVWKTAGTLEINGVSKTSPVIMAKDCTPEKVTYEFDDETNVLEMSSTVAAVIWDFEITYTIAAQ